MILVWGWFGNSNIGDELFKDAFRTLFPDLLFKFVSEWHIADLEEAQLIILGGGSFLDQEMTIMPTALHLLKHKPLMYIGVGAETNISLMHQDLIRRAQLVAIRSPAAEAKVKTLNPNTIVIPDLVYALREQIVRLPVVPKTVLVLPNIEVVPSYRDPHWKHASFDYFKSEFAQFLDSLVDRGYQLHFQSMCRNDYFNDDWAAASIIAMMSKRSLKYQLPYLSDIQQLTQRMSQYSCVVTQRYHGIVLAEMVGAPYITICHHDKLKSATSLHSKPIPYYGITKASLFEAFNTLTTYEPIETHLFDTLRQRVHDIVRSYGAFRRN